MLDTNMGKGDPGLVHPSPTPSESSKKGRKGFPKISPLLMFLHSTHKRLEECHSECAIGILQDGKVLREG